MNFFITGGASGLGNAITKAIAEQNPDATIYFTFYSSEENKKVLEKNYKNAIGIKCDFKNEEDIIKIEQFIQANNIDILINNALTGITKEYFHKLDYQILLDSFKTDVVATLSITKAFLKNARKKRSGRIITVLTAALANNMPPIGWSMYVANKAYLLSMNRSWAAENKHFNITSNCVSPDFMLTSLNTDTDERVIEEMVSKHPLKQLLSVDDTAKTVLFLCSSPTHLNGQNIIINAAQF
jgi:NAD(P)-dependent dehydrogenase (short-subunit alcohol dehydrogenase family)